jgi:RAB protein geranylgeranyltransferase component A
MDDRYFCEERFCNSFVDKNHRCEQWSNTVRIPAGAIEAIRAEALKVVAEKCDMQHFMGIVINWAQDTGTIKKVSLYHMQALAERLLSISEHTILADKQEPGRDEVGERR